MEKVNERLWSWATEVDDGAIRQVMAARSDLVLVQPSLRQVLRDNSSVQCRGVPSGRPGCDRCRAASVTAITAISDDPATPAVTATTRAASRFSREGWRTRSPSAPGLANEANPSIRRGIGVTQQLLEVPVAGRRPGGVVGRALLGRVALGLVRGGGVVHWGFLPRAARRKPGEDGDMAIDLMDPLFKLAKVVHPALLRLSGGRLGGTVMGMPVVVVTTTGRKSGQPRSAPLTVIQHEGRTYVIASKGGDQHHPAWYLNMVANPEVTVQRDGGSQTMTARVLPADERDAIWPVVTETYKGYAGYQKKTDRTIPVVELVPPTDATG